MLRQLKLSNRETPLGDPQVVPERLPVPKASAPLDVSAGVGVASRTHIKCPFRNDLVSVTEKREKTSEPRGSGQTLSSPTEEPLLKRKDAPRPRQKDGDDVPPWRERPT